MLLMLNIYLPTTELIKIEILVVRINVDNIKYNLYSRELFVSLSKVSVDINFAHFWSTFIFSRLEGILLTNFSSVCVQDRMFDF